MGRAPAQYTVYCMFESHPRHVGIFSNYALACLALYIPLSLDLGVRGGFITLTLKTRFKFACTSLYVRMYIVYDSAS